jgi:hypothetical protein
MSGETNLAPDEVVTAAARLAVTSEDLRQRIDEALVGIRGVDVRSACGDDEPGEALYRSVAGSSDGVDGGVADSIIDGTEQVCGDTYTLAEGTGIGAIESRMRDEEAESQIQGLMSQLEDYGVTPALLENSETLDMVNQLQSLMSDPRAPELVGEARAAEITGFLADVEQLAE